MKYIRDIIFYFKSLKLDHSERMVFLLCVAMAFLPVSKDISNLVLIALVINSFFAPDFSKKLANICTNILFVSYLVFYLLYLLSGFYSHNDNEYRFEIEKKLSFVILPFIFCFFTVAEFQKKKILSVFAYSCVFWLIYCLCCSSLEYFYTGDISYLGMDKLADWIGILRVYFSLYLFLALVIFWHNLKEGFGNKYFSIAGAIFCFLGMMLFMSRIQLPILLFFICLLIFRYFSQRKMLMKGVIVLSFILAGFSSMIYFVKPLNRQFIGAIEKFHPKYAYTEDANGFNERIIMWSCGKKLVCENVWLGVGVGDLYDDMTECYRGIGIYNKDRAPAHNQYLQVFISIGIVGLALFVFILVIQLIDAFRTKDTLYQSFIVIFCLSFLTESILEMQKGLVLFMLFGLLFYVNNRTKNITIIQ